MSENEPLRLDEPAVPAEDRGVRARDLDDCVRVRVLPVRRDRVRLAAGPGRRRSGRGIPRHVGEAATRVGGADERAAVVGEAVVAVVVGAAEVDDVRLARGRVDDVVVPALAGAVVDVLATRRRQVGEGRCPACVIRAEEAGSRGRPAVPSPRYIRVFPFGSFVTSNEGRSGSAAFGGLIWPRSRRLQQAEAAVPPFSERHVPLVERRCVHDARCCSDRARGRHAAVRAVARVPFIGPAAVPDEGEVGATVGRLEQAVRRPRRGRIRRRRGRSTELTPRTPRAEAT